MNIQFRLLVPGAASEKVAIAAPRSLRPIGWWRSLTRYAKTNLTVSVRRNARGIQALSDDNLKWRVDMPAKSKAQQKAAGAALAAKRGETSVNKLKGASKSMYESMSEKQLDEFASTKRKGKPDHVSKKR